MHLILYGAKEFKSVPATVLSIWKPYFFKFFWKIRILIVAHFILTSFTVSWINSLLIKFYMSNREYVRSGDEYFYHFTLIHRICRKVGMGSKKKQWFAKIRHKECRIEPSDRRSKKRLIELIERLVRDYISWISSSPLKVNAVINRPTHEFSQPSNSGFIP